MARRLIFLADVHLHPGDAARADRLVAFLHEQRGQAEAAYVLGDLFDFWVGAKQLRCPAWARLLERLGEVARAGLPLRILGGNRDYLLDAPSLSPFGLESLGRRHTFDYDGHRFTLVHGDRQYPDSLHSRLFLRCIHSGPMCVAARSVPLGVSLAVARGLRRWRQWVSRYWDPAAAPRYQPARFLPLLEATGADVIVCGHNHWAKDYTAELGRPGCRLFALGEWADAPSYLEYADGTFCLRDPRLPGD
jgi:UDP-2,3-diacylglucosamine hydrolase